MHRPGENHTDPCLQFTTINKLGNSAQPLGRHFHKKESCSNAVVPRAVLIRFGYGGDQFAPRAKNLKRAFLRVAANEIDHGVGIINFIFEALRLKVHYSVCTEGLHVVDVFGRYRRDQA